MTVSVLRRDHTARQGGLDITVRTGSGTGRTPLSAFDRALQRAGVADFNLITLSSVIPPHSRIRTVDAELDGGHGDALFCVRAQAFADQPGQTVWAGLGWCTDETGGGLFVEHRGETEQSLIEQIELSLGDMNADRGGGYGPVQIAVASARCVDDPVCALVVAAYRVFSWSEAEAEVTAAPGVPTISGRPAAKAPVPDRATADEAGPHGPSAPMQAEPPGATRVTVEDVIEGQVALDFYQLYRDSFTALETEAVARHVLHLPEFLDEMRDPRYVKYVAWNDQDEAVGITTLANDLSAVPWISPEYFAHHYPEQYDRSAIYYLGLTLVQPGYRGSRIYRDMFIAMSDLVLTGSTVVAWDMCTANDERGFMRNVNEFLDHVADAGVEVVDRQTYYVGTFNGPARNASPESATA